MIEGLHGMMPVFSLNFDDSFGFLQRLIQTVLETRMPGAKQLHGMSEQIQMPGTPYTTQN